MEDEPDKLLQLDLMLFAQACKLRLYTYGNDWTALAVMEGHQYAGYGSRPWSAVHACFLKARHNTDGRPV